jgi:YD repeat-containing protein
MNVPGSAKACPGCAYPLNGARPGSIGPVGLLLSLVGVAFAAVALLQVVLFINGEIRLSNSGLPQQAMKIAQASPELRKLMGGEAKAAGLPLGWISRYYGADFAQWSAPIKGPSGPGDLHAVANGIGGDWEFFRLTFVPNKNEGAGAIDLTPVPGRLSLPPVMPKTVYLLPLDLAPEDSLAWAPAYYQGKLGIDVKLLPSLAVSAAVEHGNQRQLDAEKCVELMRHAYPDLNKDPGAILVGVTSRDMTIVSFHWSYAENYRHGDRFGMVSSARYQPFPLLGKWNPEWRVSRLQKMLTKNVVMLYFDLPLSNDETSLLSGGVVSANDVDAMTGKIIGAAGTWKSFTNSGEPQVTICDIPGRKPFWTLDSSDEGLPDVSAQVFNADVGLGLFMQRKADFQFDGKFPLTFMRVSRNQEDHSRQFGIGAMDSLDMYLIGQMGNYVDLLSPDGARVHYAHVPAAAGQSGDTYVTHNYAGEFSDSVAVYAGDGWRITRKDGWTFTFPYRPKALGAQVTVLTGYSDAAGNTYAMERNPAGDLLSLTTPGGEWLHFDSDEQHRFRHISDASGREVSYEYDAGGRLTKVTDNAGHSDVYTYDARGQMLTAAHGSDAPVITNEYEVDGHIKSQTMAGGARFEYHYVQDRWGRGNAMVPDLITDPNGLLTFIKYVGGGYQQSLPEPPPH